MPFAGVANYVRNRVNPLASTQIDLLQNKDYYGKQILKGDFLERLLRGVEYEVEGVLPLTAGTVAELGRQSLETGETMDWGETGWQTIGQFAGANVMKVNLRTQDALDRAMTKLGLAGATEANLKQRQARYEAYFEIPSDVDEVKANRKEFPYTRAEYLERYPDVEAKLFILGKISSFKKADDETYPGRDIALRLMIENKLTVDDIAGLKLPAYPSQAEKDRRRWFELELESQATAPVAPAKAERRLTPKGTRPKGYVPSFGR